MECNFDAAEEGTRIPALLRNLSELGIGYTDLQTRQSSLEDIFVGLVGRNTPDRTGNRNNPAGAPS